MSIRKLLAESRRSGPAKVYALDPDGTILAVTERPARGPFKPGRLTREESLFLLTRTGRWPETFPAAAYCGCQPNDWDLSVELDTRPDSLALRSALRASGIMTGVADSGLTASET